MAALLEKSSMLSTMATANIESDYVFENNIKRFKCLYEICKN